MGQRHRLTLLLPLAAAFAALAAAPVYAHGFGERTELPAPLGYFLIGAAAAVAVSFGLLSYFLRATPGGGYWRYDLLRVPWLGAALAWQPLHFMVKLLSVFLLGLVIATGFAGEQDPSLNFAPTFVWVIWWVGMAFAVALLGNLWALVNPWQNAFDGADWLCRKLAGRPLSLGRPYPEAWGIWPALLLFLGFVWLQDAFAQSELPNRVAGMAVAYSAISWAGMFWFGREAWLRNGEAFSVVFRTLARFSPTEARAADSERCRRCPAGCLEDDGECVDCYECFRGASGRQFNLRPYAMGLSRGVLNPGVLSRGRESNDWLALVVLLLATVTFDGFSATSAWLEFQSFVVQTAGGGGNSVFNSLTLADTLGVLLFPVGFLLVYLLFAGLMARSSGEDAGAVELARVFAFSLIPIALAYNIAHFITLLLVQGQLLVPLVSDPFGFGWDLFGTAGYAVDTGIIGTKIVWFLSVALIVVGHILSVYLAHLLALRVFPGRSAALSSQYPMLALMVVYTVISLWIIAQPIVI